MAHAVHAPKLAMKHPFLDPPLGRLAAEAGFQQLSECDDTVLAASDPGHLMLR
jgi:hypothetical protein